MDFKQALTFLEQGMTLDEVIQLRDAEKPKEETPKEDTPKEDKKEDVKETPNEGTPAEETIPKWAESLNSNIEKLTKTIQAQAIANSSMPTPKGVQEMADEVLVGLFNKKKEGKE